MKPPRSKAKPSARSSVLWDLLTLEKLMTGSLVHLVYWFGLGIVALAVLWRSFCELYVVVIRIGEDLTALRRAAESQGVLPADPGKV